ncbi:MAG: acyl-CoA thioesterase [Gammaproteobacteria bacterium]
MKYAHRLEFCVRDYECDMQGVVNNGVYQNYLEHARHEFLQSRGINFADMTVKRINLVVVRAELDYRNSLRSNDQFVVCSNIQRISRLRFEFLQDIFRIPDQTLMLQARIVGTSLNQRGRPFIAQELSKLFDDCSLCPVVPVLPGR